MPPSVEFQGFENFEGLFEGLSANAVDQVSAMFAGHLREEVPVKSNKLKKSIKVIKAKKTANGYTGGVEIGKDLSYFWKVLVGSSENERYHFATDKVMRFRDWDNGPSHLRAADGFFYFRKVRHNIPPNDFIARSLAKMDYRKVKRIFEESVRKAILRGK